MADLTVNSLTKFKDIAFDAQDWICAIKYRTPSGRTILVTKALENPSILIPTYLDTETNEELDYDPRMLKPFGHLLTQLQLTIIYLDFFRVSKQGRFNRPHETFYAMFPMARRLSQNFLPTIQSKGDKLTKEDLETLFNNEIIMTTIPPPKTNQEDKTNLRRSLNPILTKIKRQRSTEERIKRKTRIIELNKNICTLKIEQEIETQTNQVKKRVFTVDKRTKTSPQQKLPLNPMHPELTFNIFKNVNKPMEKQVNIKNILAKEPISIKERANFINPMLNSTLHTKPTFQMDIDNDFNTSYKIQQNTLKSHLMNNSMNSYPIINPNEFSNLIALHFDQSKFDIPLSNLIMDKSITNECVTCIIPEDEMVYEPKFWKMYSKTVDITIMPTYFIFKYKQYNINIHVSVCDRAPGVKHLFQIVITSLMPIRGFVQFTEIT
jgi:hypothetical protein